MYHMFPDGLQLPGLQDEFFLFLTGEEPFLGFDGKWKVVEIKWEWGRHMEAES